MDKEKARARAWQAAAAAVEEAEDRYDLILFARVVSKDHYPPGRETQIILLDLDHRWTVSRYFTDIFLLDHEVTSAVLMEGEIRELARMRDHRPEEIQLAG